jgi:hypothetical protein
MEKSVKTLNEYQVALPAVTRHLIQEHQAGRLGGAKLEFAVRLLSDQVDKVRAAATAPPPVSKK